jgi:hypothetical protein
VVGGLIHSVKDKEALQSESRPGRPRAIAKVSNEAGHGRLAHASDTSVPSCTV